MKIKYIFSVFSVFSLAGAYMLPSAAIPNFKSIEVSVPSGTNNSSGAGTFSSGTFSDDVFLEEIKFGTTTFTDSDDNFRAVQRLEVISGQDQVNAEWGAQDDGNDDDDTPLVKAGFDPNTVDQESTDPNTQNTLLQEAFSSTNLSEIADGEGAGGGSYKIRLIFDESVTDNDNGDDEVPEVILFERGGNDAEITFELITGGTFNDPTFGGSFSSPSSSADFSKTGIFLNTQEIGNAQELFVIGLDFSKDFGLAADTSVFGIDITSSDGGADIGDVFLTSTTPENSFKDDVPLALSEPVPFEVEGSMGAVLLGAFLWYRHRKRQSNYAYNQEGE